MSTHKHSCLCTDPVVIFQERIAEMLVDLQLEAKSSAFATELSGGQKRRLSVGMALVGNARVVILDEPTSGMDPQARRATWEVCVQCTSEDG